MIRRTDDQRGIWPGKLCDCPLPLWYVEVANDWGARAFGEGDTMEDAIHAARRRMTE